MGRIKDRQADEVGVPPGGQEPTWSVNELER